MCDVLARLDGKIIEHFGVQRGAAIVYAPRRPLICRILFESILLAILFICFHVLEHSVIGLIKREDRGKHAGNWGRRLYRASLRCRHLVHHIDTFLCF